MLAPTYRYVLCFAFDDGAESGLAVEADGAGARFDCLGDAHRTGLEEEGELHRAFLFERIGGNWLSRVEACGREPCVGKGAAERFIFPDVANSLVAEIGRDAQSANSLSYFVAVAHPYLDEMQCAEVDANTAEAFAASSQDLYREIRDFVRVRVPGLR